MSQCKPLNVVAMILLLAAGAFGEAPAVVAKPEGIVTDGVPEISKDLAERIRRYGQSRGAIFQGWRPAGREVLVATRFGDTMQMHAVARPGGARRQLTFYSEPVSGGSYPPAGEGEFFVFQKDRDGNEQYQKYRFDLSTGRETLLTDGTSRNVGTAWSDDGKFLAYGSTRRTGKDVDLWVVDPRGEKSERMVVQNEGGGWGVADWSPDAKRLLVVEYISAVEQRLWLVDVAGGRKTLVAPGADEGKVTLSDAQFSGDGKGIYVATDRGGAEFQHLAFFDLGTGEWKTLTGHIPWNVDDFRLSWNGKRIALVTNEEGFSVLRLLDVESGKFTDVTGVPRGAITGLQWHRNNRDIGFTAASAQTTADVYSVNVEDGKVERWTESETGGIPSGEFAQAELIKWESFDGRPIPAFIYRPATGKFPGKRPVIVLIHGGPESQARPTYLGSYNYYINELGVAVVEPNIRGSAGYGKSYLAMDDGVKREDAYRDIGTLLDWIGRQPDLDKDRILITGGSYGGNVVQAVSFMYPEKIRCAVSSVGSSNLVTFLENTSPYRRDLRRVEYGDERDPKVREYLEGIAPINHLDKMTKPLLVIQGGNDPRVPASEAEQIVRAFKAKNKPIWYILAKDEGHGFARQSNREFEQAVRAEFVKRFLVD